MKKITAAAALILGVIASGQALAAAPSAKLSVTGKLLPVACTLSTTGDSLDLGDLNINALSETKPTEMTDNVKEFDITVSCPSPTYTGITISDVADTGDFKLGKYGTYKLELNIGESQIDGKRAGGSLLRNGEGGAFIETGGFKPIIENGKGSNKGIDLTNGSNRVKAEVKLFHVIVTPTINATKDLDLSQEHDITGSATIDLLYM